MAKYLDSNGLSHFMGKLKAYFLTDVGWSSNKLTKTKGGTTSDVHTFAAVATSGSYDDLSDKPTIPTPASASSTTPAMDGTASAGSESAWAHGDHVHPTDTSRAAASHMHGNITNDGDITVYVPIASGDRLVINDESVSKLVNSSITFGTSTSQFLCNDGTWRTPVRYTDSEAVSALMHYAEEESKVLLSDANYTHAEKTKLAGIATAASIADGATGYTTGDQVYDFVTAQMGDVAGALVYKGTAAAATTITGASYKKGWYWIASADFTVGGANVEAGDMIIAKQDKTSTVADDLDVVQTNIETLTTSEIDALWTAA